MRTWLEIIGGVMLPRGCAGCDVPDAVLCDRCRGLLLQQRSFAVPGTRLGCGYACARYSGAVRRAILGWKDHGDEECDGVFADAIMELVTTRLRDVCTGEETVTVVPAPSSGTSLRRRGRWQTRVLADAVARACSAAGCKAMVSPLLSMGHVRGRSVQMQAGQRSLRVNGRIAVRNTGGCIGRSMIVVDDIVTTGATMRQCVEALRSAGGVVITCLALAHTPAPGTSEQVQDPPRCDTSAG